MATDSSFVYCDFGKTYGGKMSRGSLFMFGVSISVIVFLFTVLFFSSHTL